MSLLKVYAKLTVSKGTLDYCVSWTREQYELMRDQPTNAFPTTPKLVRQDAYLSNAYKAKLSHPNMDEDSDDEDMKPPRQVDGGREQAGDGPAHGMGYQVTAQRSVFGGGRHRVKRELGTHNLVAPE
ncbi:hypothetical protein G6011_02776 [Alternaria panax]|uniref:Uncharacterized protein n=1 Tax=Alternaria panax TaxID=48097 RepID=A0AAD4FA99_9PLEO|nr:hypothetical protein G6011_02776 [Alternaria panax]